MRTDVTVEVTSIKQETPWRYDREQVMSVSRPKQTFRPKQNLFCFLSGTGHSASDITGAVRLHRSASG